jgi:ankyrin repeat protein
MTSGLDVSLISSAKIGLLNQTKQWLDAGADIHANSDEPLRVASLYGNVKVVRLLLDRGANIHALDDYALRYP